MSQKSTIETCPYPGQTRSEYLCRSVMFLFLGGLLAGCATTDQVKDQSGISKYYWLENNAQVLVLTTRIPGGETRKAYESISAAEWATLIGEESEVIRLLQNSSSKTRYDSLLSAIKVDRPKLAAKIAESYDEDCRKEAEADVVGIRPLHLAAQHGHRNLVLQFVRLGHNVNAVRQNPSDIIPALPLDYATDPDIREILIDAGAVSGKTFIQYRSTKDM